MKPAEGVPTDTVMADAETSAALQGRHADASRNTIALLASRLTISVLGWAGTVLIARLLSPHDWGVFSFVFGLLGMMSIVTDLGVGRVVLARLLDSDPEEADAVASSFVSLRAALGLVGYLLALGYVVVMGYDREVILATALAGLVVVVATPSHALMTLYQSRLKLTVVAAAEAFAQLFQLILTVLAAVTMPTLLIFILPAIANELLSGTWKLIGIRRGWVGTRITARPRAKLWREMLVEAVPLSIGLGMVTLLSKVDILMLGKLDTFDSVGQYTVAYKFADLMGNVVLAVLTPAAILLVAAWPLAPAEFRDRVRSTAVTIALLTAAAVVGMWAVAEPVIALLYGERFVEAADSTRMLLVGAVLGAITQLILVSLVSAGKHRAYPWLALGGLLLNIGLNYILIPSFSYTGSAVATVLTELVMLLAMWALMARTIGIRGLMPVGKLAQVGALSAAVCTLTTVCAKVWQVPWPAVLSMSVVLYVLGVFLLRLADAGNLRGLLSKRKADK